MSANSGTTLHLSGLQVCADTGYTFNDLNAATLDAESGISEGKGTGPVCLLEIADLVDFLF